MLTFKDYFTLIISGIALLISCLNFFWSRNKTRSEETQKVYNDWFSVEFYKLRKEYKRIKEKIHGIDGWERRKFEDILEPNEIESLMKLIYFFDKVGWLWKVKLVNVRYIIQPMGQWVIKTWDELQPIIKTKRENDKINSSGFEELAKYAKKYK